MTKSTFAIGSSDTLLTECIRGGYTIGWGEEFKKLPLFVQLRSNLVDAIEDSFINRVITLYPHDNYLLLHSYNP